MCRNTERKSSSAAEELLEMEKGRNIVAVIGIDRYEHWRTLHNAVADARGIQKFFEERLGFAAPLDPLLNKEATKEAITELVVDKLRRELEPADSLLLFFAGHGHTEVDPVGENQVETGYIVPVEASEAERVGLVKVEDFMDDVSKLPARHVLLVLDACHSGFALGQAMRTHRSKVRYQKDLASRLSRKVITSARHDQRALDGGPVEGHSLFTGRLIQGLNWGTADTDGDELVTSFELGLFLQQRVGKDSESKQTPDFGSFFLDDRGEMVISLRDDTFDALKARAFAALRRGEVDRFKDQTEKVSARRPDSPEALYLQYRACLVESDVQGARELVDRLLALDLRRGTIRLHQHDLETLRAQLAFWEPLFAVQEGGCPLDVGLSIGTDRDHLHPAKQEAIGDLEGYLFESGVLAQYEVTNRSCQQAHVYWLTIGPDGRLSTGPLVRDVKIMMDGLSRDDTVKAMAFEVKGFGLKETRLFWSPELLTDLLSPPSAATRTDLDEQKVVQMKMKRVWYVVKEAVGRHGP